MESLITQFQEADRITVKVPPSLFSATVKFYQRIMKLQILEEYLPQVCFEYGNCRVWICSEEGAKETEILVRI